MDTEKLYDSTKKTSISILSVATVSSICLYYYHVSRRRSLPPKTQFLSVAWSIFRHWRSFFKGLLSLSLSRSEQSIFEEEFKYLIITSSLFNETFVQLQEDKQYEMKEGDGSDENNNKQLLFRVLVISTLSIISTSIIMKCNNSVSLWIMPCILLVYIIMCYFIYRRHRHAQIRRIHVSALASMRQVISLSQESDALLASLLIHCDETKQQLGTLLCSHFETYIDLVQQLQPLIDSQNLSRLREMYNVNQEIPSTLLEFDSNDEEYTMEDIDLIHTVIGWKRREYLLYLIALDVMSTNQRNKYYGKTWRLAIQINTNLVKEYNQFKQKLAAIVSPFDSDTEERQQKHNIMINSPTSSSSTETSFNPTTTTSSLSSDKRSLALMHRVSAVEKYIEDIQAKLFLCKQDTKSFSSGRVSALTLEKMNKQFNHIDHHISTFLTQWEESKNALNNLLKDEQTMAFPSPPSSPRVDHSHNDDDKEGNNSNSFSRQHGRSKSCSSSLNNRPSLSKNNRLQRIRSLKINKSESKKTE